MAELTMRLNEKADKERRPKRCGQADEDSLWAVPNSGRIDGIEHRWRNDTSKCVEQSGRAKKRTRLIVRYVLRKCRLQGWRTDTANGCNDTRNDEQLILAHECVAKVAECVE